MVKADPLLWGQAEEGWEPAEVLEIEQKRRKGTGPVEAEGAREQQQRQEDAVVERKDAEGAASVEGAEVARTADGVLQDAGDEEAGEDEEEVDTGGGEDERGVDDEASVRHVAGEQMRGHDAEDGEAAQAVERCDVAAAKVAGTRFTRGRLRGGGGAHRVWSEYRRVRWALRGGCVARMAAWMRWSSG